jgi:hypothetical protein
MGGKMGNRGFTGGGLKLTATPRGRRSLHMATTAPTRTAACCLSDLAAQPHIHSNSTDPQQPTMLPISWLGLRDGKVYILEQKCCEAKVRAWRCVQIGLGVLPGAASRWCCSAWDLPCPPEVGIHSNMPSMSSGSPPPRNSGRDVMPHHLLSWRPPEKKQQPPFKEELQGCPLTSLACCVPSFKMKSIESPQ